MQKLVKYDSFNYLLVQVKMLKSPFSPGTHTHTQKNSKPKRNTVM